MARGTRIVVTPDVGKFEEGVVAAGQTFTPGMIVQSDPSVALQGGRHTYKLYDADLDGGRPKGKTVIVVEDRYQGKTVSDTYAAGARFFGFTPWPGCEINLLLADVAGTGDDHAAGEVIIPKDTTGKWIATTGSPEMEPAKILETVTDPVADTLVWCEWIGF